MKEHLWKSKSLLEKLQCTIGGKKFQVGFIEKGKKNSFTLPTSPLPQGGTAQFQERTPWPTFIPWMKVTMCEWVLDLHRCCPSGPPLFSPTQKTEVNSTAEGLGEVGTQQLVLRIHQKDAANCFTVSPTKCFLDSIRKPTHKPLGTLYFTYSLSDWSTATFNGLCTSTPSPPMWWLSCSCFHGWWVQAFADGCRLVRKLINKNFRALF